LSPSARARIPGLSLNVKSKGLRPRWADLCGLFAAFRVPGVGGAVAGQHCQQSRRCSRSSLRTPKNVIEVAPRRRPGHPNRPTFPSEPLRGAGNDALRQRSLSPSPRRTRSRTESGIAIPGWLRSGSGPATRCGRLPRSPVLDVERLDRSSRHVAKIDRRPECRP
jgi:hypothetical protein